MPAPPMTDKQRDYLESLCLKKDHDFDPTLSKWEASGMIDYLKALPTPKPRGPKVSLKKVRRARRSEPRAVILNADVMFVANTNDVSLAIDLMSVKLRERGLSPEDIAVCLEEPVALAPWFVEPGRKRQFLGVLFRS